MIDHKKVVFSYLNSQEIKIAKRMTKEEAQKIVNKMSPAKVKKYIDLIKKWFKFFKVPFNKKDADIYDIIGKMGKRLGLPVLQLTAILMLYFGGAFPTYGDEPVVDETKIEQVVEKADPGESVDKKIEPEPKEPSPDEEGEGEKRPLEKVRADLGKVFELPKGTMALVKTMPQFAINLKGIDGFVKTVGKGLEKSITPEVSKLLNEVDTAQWPEVLSGLVIEKIEADPAVSKKFNKFVKHHKTTSNVMKKNIADTVTRNKANIEKFVAKGIEKDVTKKAMAIRIAISVTMKKTAYERGYLIS
jgi:hypothetical protein